MGKQQGRKLGCRLVLFPKPYLGHITPMLNLGNLLHSKGFSITIIQTCFNAPDPSKFPMFTFHYIEDAMSKAEAPPSDVVQIINLLNRSCLEPFEDCLSQVLEDASNDKEAVSCLISDTMWEFAATVADGFNLPRLALRTGGVLDFILCDAVPLLCDKGYLPISIQDSEARQEEPGLDVPFLKELSSAEVAAVVNETKEYPQGIICNTFKELEGSVLDRPHRNILSVPIFTIGPLHKYFPTSVSNVVTQEESSIVWLNSQAPKSVLYVSFGTLVAISKEQFVEIAWGLARSKQPFLWVVGPRFIQGFENNAVSYLDQNFIENVSGRGHIVTWAPQQQVLAHPAVGGFLNHCGWNSTIESICEGVPMLCHPFFGDQKMNARHICDILRIGVELDKGLEEQKIEQSIKKLMVEKEGQEMRERAAALKEQADHCLMKGGSSYESLDQLINRILSFGCIQPTKELK